MKCLVGLVEKMGCTASRDMKTDPNIMYKKDGRNGLIIQNHKNKVSPEKPNINGQVVNSEQGNTGQSVKQPVNRTLKGDLIIKSEARLGRERRLRDVQSRREARAKEMSEKVMEEKERLSLVSSRSRATSRAASPKNSRRGKTLGPGSVLTDRDVLLSGSSSDQMDPSQPSTSRAYNEQQPSTSHGTRELSAPAGRTILHSDMAPLPESPNQAEYDKT